MDAQADSIMLLMDKWYAYDNPADSVMPRLTSKLQNRCRQLPGNRQLLARLYYWKALQFSRKDLFDSAEVYIERSRRLMDSTKYPYDLARLKMVRGKQDTEGLIKGMSDAHDALQYFEATKDTLMSANTCNVLSLYYLQLDEPGYEEALRFCDKAAAGYKSIGLHSRSALTQINRALILKVMSQPDSSRKTLLAVKKSGLLEGNMFAYLKLLINLGSVGDTCAIQEGLTLMGASVQWSRQRIRFREYLANEYMMGGKNKRAEELARLDIPEALSIFEEGKKTGNPIGMDVAAFCFRLNSDRCRKALLPDSSLFFLTLSLQADSIYRSARDRTKLNEARYKAEVFRNKLEVERRDASRRFWLVLIGSILAVVMLYVVLGMRLRVNKEKLLAKEAELKQANLQIEIEKERRAIVSSSLMMTEKDNLLKAVHDDVEKLYRNGDLSYVNMNKISSMIRLHESGRNEWEQFQTVFNRVKSDFSKLLKQKYPLLTEGDVQLASYIKAGLGMKQIARMLMMTPGSIKSKRHRLRERMGLAPGESLEDVIRGLD